jgi:DNA polymerase
MSDCESCDLCKTRGQVVFGEGPENPLIMIIGEAPGEEEDTQGKPFVGPSGDKLDKILSYINIPREEVYISNAVLCKPPNNRNPRQEEIAECKWRLDLQIQLLKPKLIVVLGRIAMQSLQGEPFKGALNQFFCDSPALLSSHKDGWMRYVTGDHESLVLATYHPSYILRRPKAGYKTVLPHWTKIKKWIERERQEV